MCIHVNIVVAPSSANSDAFMPSEQDWEDYFREQWDYEPAVHHSEELQEAIKSHPGFTTPPMGPIGDYIVSEELRHIIPQSFATSYLVHSVEDASILREVVAAHGEPHPAVIVYPRCEVIQADDENLIIGDCVSLASLRLEDPTIANLVIDHFGTSTGKQELLCSYLQLNLHIYVCAGQNQCKAGLNNENGLTFHFIIVVTL